MERDLANKKLTTHEGITNMRKEELKAATLKLIDRYELHELAIQARAIDDFWDYKVRYGQIILNYSWDILYHFKASFAAKMACVLMSQCMVPSFMNRFCQGWKDFLKIEWRGYEFINQILEEYHEAWRLLNPT